MLLETLNQRFGTTDRIRFTPGQGGLPMAKLRNDAASATVSLYGGQVLSFRPSGAAEDLLFVSEKAHFAVGKAIKGGIPICWPWFGADPQAQGRPAHGFARNVDWTVESAEAINPGLTRLVLSLVDDATTQALWPYPFRLTLTVDVGDTLALSLATTNRGEQSFDITQALHTYLAIGDLDRASVNGLDGLYYLDKPRDFAVTRQAGDVTFAGEVDRIYQSVSYPLILDDPASGRQVVIDARNSKTAVVWNPGPAISESMSDLADDAFRRFVCVETANAADDVVSVPAGETRTLQTRLAIR
jgi:glucose-6-phosphate 1-epimerase